MAHTCLRLARDYGVDLLKIDFLDQAMVYRDSPCHGDLSDVGQAMAAMVALVRARLREADLELAFEFRQPYVSPALARVAEVLRAGDCPGDSVLNRVSSVDARLISVGRTIHSDPMMWGPEGGAVAVAQQLHAGWLAVPQISMQLRRLSVEQLRTLRGLLELWREHAEVVLEGQLTLSGAERGYDVVAATHPSLDRSVVARYADVVVDLDQHPTGTVMLINATPATRVVIRTGRAITGGETRAPTPR